jgi:hypothetical protein
MEYHASIEWICDHAGVMRIHEQADTEYGSAFIWSCLVARTGDQAMLKGALIAPPLHAARQIDKILSVNGIKFRVYDRFVNGVKRTIVKSTSKD